METTKTKGRKVNWRWAALEDVILTRALSHAHEMARKEDLFVPLVPFIQFIIIETLFLSACISLSLLISRGCQDLGFFFRNKKDQCPISLIIFKSFLLFHSSSHPQFSLTQRQSSFAFLSLQTKVQSEKKKRKQSNEGSSRILSLSLFLTRMQDLIPSTWISIRKWVVDPCSFLLCSHTHTHACHCAYVYTTHQ